MRKPRDFDGELKALQDKARDLKSQKVQKLGELVIATGADTNFFGNELMGKTRGCVLSEPGAANCTGS